MISNRIPSARTRRAGFTIIELLGVIAIIAILVALSAGAYFRVRVSQQESATNVTLGKLQSELMIQWTAVQDMAKEDARKRSIPDVVKTFAGNEDRRALVIWTKVKLKTEFPQNFDQAINFPALNPQAPSGYLYSASNIVIPVKSTYKQGILNFVSIGNIVPEANLTVDQAHRESAALLYISLTQSRRGMQAFNPVDHIGPHAVSTVAMNHYPGAPSFPCFVDTWGQPIPFIRWATGTTGGGRDINQPPYATAVTIQNVIVPSPDPQDPENSLYVDNAHWPTAKRNVFSQVIHPLNSLQVGPVNLSPFVFSGGRDNSDGKGNNWGIAADFSYYNGGEDDNLYGYRLRGVGTK